MIVLSGGTASLAKAFEEYRTAWKAFLVVHHLDALEHLAKATTLSWKVASKDVLYANLAALGDQIEQIHIGTVNECFIASAVLQEDFQGMRIVKILERRRGSSDRLGLDSIDYWVEDTEKMHSVLQAAGAHIEKQHNSMHEWLSLRFGKDFEFEAKFSDHLILEVAIKELQQAIQTLNVEQDGLK